MIKLLDNNKDTYEVEYFLNRNEGNSRNFYLIQADDGEHAMRIFNTIIRPGLQRAYESDCNVTDAHDVKIFREAEKSFFNVAVGRLPPKKSDEFQEC